MESEKEIDPELYKAALEFFGGNEEEAVIWLNRPARGLGWIKPVDANAEDVYRLIKQLELGVYI